MLILNSRITIFVIALVASLIVVFVARYGFGRRSVLPRPGTLGPVAGFSFDVMPETLRVGDRLVLDMRIQNPGSEGFDGLALTSRGEWSAFRFVQIDIDGSVQRGSPETVFRFNGGVRAGQVRQLRLVALALKPGNFIFTLEPLARSGRLRKAEGEPWEASFSVWVEN